MSKTYFVKFGTGDPRPYTGLSPTFLIFTSSTGGVTTPPGISEIVIGSSGTGFYTFMYEPSSPFIFLLDGGSGLASGDRYVSGPLDPIQAVDERVGTTADSFGSTSVDPSTVLGYAKRFQELWEGDQVYTKASGLLQIYNRGSTTLLRQKTLTNTTTSATKT